MEKNLSIAIIISITLNALCFNIGTNAFEFVFEDTNLSTDTKTQIADDFSTYFEKIGNKFDVLNTGPTSGQLRGDKGYLPTLSLSFKIPNTFYVLNGTNFIVISKTLSDELILGLNVHNSYTNAYASCTNFVNFLNSDSINAISSNEVKNITYQKGITDEAYRQYRDEFINSIKCYDFFNPALCSFYIMDEGFYGIIEKSIWTFLPTWENDNFQGVFGAVFFENHWHLIAPMNPILLEIKHSTEPNQ